MSRRRVYICHPYRDDPEANARRVRHLCRAVFEEGVLPIAPHVYLPQFVDEATEREQAMELCLELVGLCDELRVFGGRVTTGMKAEIAHAEANGVEVRFADS